MESDLKKAIIISLLVYFIGSMIVNYNPTSLADPLGSNPINESLQNSFNFFSNKNTLVLFERLGISSDMQDDIVNQTGAEVIGSEGQVEEESGSFLTDLYNRFDFIATISEVVIKGAIIIATAAKLVFFAVVGTWYFAVMVVPRITTETTPIPIMFIINAIAWSLTAYVMYLYTSYFFFKGRK